MEKYFDKKLDCLCRMFPQYSDEMLTLMRAFDAFYQKPVSSFQDLQDYIINFAVHSNLEICSGTGLGLDMRIKELQKQNQIMSACTVGKKYQIKNARFLLKKYGSALRYISQFGQEKLYLTADKESDFLFWLKNQKMALRRNSEIELLEQYNNASRGMSFTPVESKRKNGTDDVWDVTDAQMHKIATILATKHRVKEPNIVLNDMIIAAVRKKAKQK